jgi:hypothetical protein
MSRGAAVGIVVSLIIVRVAKRYDAQISRIVNVGQRIDAQRIERKPFTDKQLEQFRGNSTIKGVKIVGLATR